MDDFEKMIKQLEGMILAGTTPLPGDLCRVVLVIGREVLKLRTTIHSGYTRIDPRDLT